MRVLSALFVAALLAGCAASAQQPGADAPAGESAAAVVAAALPCEAPMGPGTTANLAKLAELDVGPGATGEMDVRGDTMLVARYQDGGLHVVDISDPADPKLVGTLSRPGTRALDVKWLPTGNAAVVGDFGRIFVVDLTNLAAPVVRSTFSYSANGISGQAHMLEPAVLGGKEYVFVASQTDRQPMYILERVGWNLELRGRFGLPLVNSLPLGNHDMTLVDDQLLGSPVLYSADGLAGWAAADVTDPTKPVRLGGSLGPEPGVGYVHTIRVDFIEGRRIVVTMTEVGVNTLKVYDATDLQAPLLLARWSADPTRPQIPQHNLQFRNEWLYMAHYTEGVYVFNMSEVARSLPLAGTLEMRPVAHYAVEEPARADVLGFANVWEVVVDDGALFVGDMADGLHSVAFGCIPLGDERHSATD